MSLPKIAWSATAVLFVVLVGCGKKEATKPTDAGSDTKGTTSTDSGHSTANHPSATPDKGTSTPAAPAVLQPNDPTQKAAEKFLSDLSQASSSPGALPPELLTRIAPSFLKVIGKPLLSADDKQRGYRSEEVEGWLRRTGSALAGIGLPTGYGTSTLAVFVGTFNNGTGRFLLRLVQIEGSWKVDWFQLGTAQVSESKPSSTDGHFQNFAAQVFLDALTSTIPSRDDRARLVGAVLSAKTREEEWASPFAQDKERGFDYGPTKLADLVDKLGSGVAAYAFTPTESGQFRVELTKGGAKKTFTLKLVKGAGLGDWQVESFVPQI